jgi:hypothetical protein
LAWGRPTRARQLWDRSVARRERRPPETKFELRPDPEQSSPPRAAADKARSRPEGQAALHREFSQKRPPGRSAPPRIISKGDLNLLLDRFVDTYNRGDLDGFMALFARRAMMDEIGGKTAIRMDYQRIFGDTLSRRLAINLLDWQLIGAHAFGIGRYRVRVQRRGESSAESYTGVIRFEVSKQQGRVKITSLSHDVR